jgi:8-amino-7-oxononanoate synthase
MADESDKTRGGRVRPNQLQILDEVGLFRVPVLGIRGKDILSTNGRRYIDFCQTSYLYFDFDPLLNDRGYAWTREWGSVPGWSRMEADSILYGRFEERLAALLGAPRVLTLPTITVTNFSLIPGIVTSGERGLILADKKLHTVVYEACRLARDHGATLRTFRHQDLQDLERLLKEHAALSPKLIAVDGVYSVSTELAPICELQALCETYDAFLYVDDAHGFGILGRDPSADNPYGTMGSGCITHAGGSYDRTFYVAGFAKSFCAATAFATIPDRFADRVRSFALSYLFSNPSTPHTLGMCDAALDLNEQRGEAARARIRELVRYLVERLRAEGLCVHNNKLQPVVFLEVGPIDDLIAVGRALDAGGVISGYRAYPVVPEDQCGLRFALTAGHERRHLDHLLELLCAPATRARMRSAQGAEPRRA